MYLFVFCLFLLVKLVFYYWLECLFKCYIGVFKIVLVLFMFDKLFEFSSLLYMIYMFNLN